MLLSCFVYSLPYFGPNPTARSLARPLYLRATTTLHHALVLWHVAAEPLFFLQIPIPVLLEGIEVQFHDLRQDVSLAFLFDAVDEFVEDPGAGDELGGVSIAR